MTSEETLANFANAVGTDIKQLSEAINIFQIENVSDSDLLQYSSSLGKWKNIKKETILDGGNF